MARPVLLTHGSSLRHDPGRTHPEHADRLRAIERTLAARDWAGWEHRDSQPADVERLLAVHPEAHVAFIRALCERGGGAIDADTGVSAGSYEAALHGAGGAVEAVDLVLSGAAPTAFSAHRPPGHHAEAARAMGFCLLNSVAVAAQAAIDVHGLERVLVFDWDVHHGNGTNDIFHATDEVLFVSIHESPLYPGTGPASDTGSGDGSGFTVNLPVGHGTGDDAWVSVVEHVVAPLARAYEPQLVLVSAGYDAHAEDPLAGCAVTDAGFAAMAASVRAFAGDVGAPVAAVLEGGYAPAALARSVAATLEVFGAAEGPAAPPVARHPLADAALARLAGGRWGAAVA